MDGYTLYVSTGPNPRIARVWSPSRPLTMIHRKWQGL
jgi:hypothetical protein